MQKGCGIYVEKHHIIPKSEGGSDDQENLVCLTAREHFIAHLLLAKIYNDHKMLCALMMMRVENSFHSRTSKISSRVFQRMREKFADKVSNFFKGSHYGVGKKMPDSFSKKLSARMIGNAVRKGSTLSKEQKERISTSQVGSHWYNNGEVNVFRKTCPEGFVEGRIVRWKISEEHRKNMSVAKAKWWAEKKRRKN